ncbi:alkyl sulfatase C-terminal domain-containing protein [Streptomyces chryseus]
MVLTDEGRGHRLTLYKGALTHRHIDADSRPRTPAGLTLTVTKPQLIDLLAGQGIESVGHEATWGCSSACSRS